MKEEEKKYNTEKRDWALLQVEQETLTSNKRKGIFFYLLVYVTLGKKAAYDVSNF